jgi:PleD family two-component response regulator
MNPSEFENPEARPNAETERAETRTILFIDNGHRDRRRERNSALTDAGYRVHPARSFEQSLSRIGSGAYDLVIANTDAATESALRFVQEVKRNFPRQKLLVLKGSGMEVPGEFDFSSSDPKTLTERVDSLLRPERGHSEQPLAA